jgi:uncharacterized protein HemY
MQTARSLNILGNIYLKQHEFVKAEALMSKALDIYTKTNHPEIYFPLESLANLYE